MTARQRAWPRQWLMTDERMDARLWTAIGRLPPNDAGIVFRHYATDGETRAALASRIAQFCNLRGITLAIARDSALARSLGADLIHNPVQSRGDLPFSRSVHSLEEAESARKESAELVFVSPIYPTRSHPGCAALGKAAALRIAEAARVPAIALGGMNRRKFLELERGGFYGWAAIDAWLRDAPDA